MGRIQSVIFMAHTLRCGHRRLKELQMDEEEMRSSLDRPLQFPLEKHFLELRHQIVIDHNDRIDETVGHHVDETSYSTALVDAMTMIQPAFQTQKILLRSAVFRRGQEIDVLLDPSASSKLILRKCVML